MSKLAAIVLLLFHTTLAREEGFTRGWPFIQTWAEVSTYNPVTQPTEWRQWWAGYDEARAIQDARE